MTFKYLRLDALQEILIQEGRADDAAFIGGAFSDVFLQRPCNLTVDGTYVTASRHNSIGIRGDVLTRGAEIIKPYRTQY